MRGTGLLAGAFVRFVRLSDVFLCGFAFCLHAWLRKRFKGFRVCLAC